MLLAAVVATYSMSQIAIAIVIFLALVALVYIAARAFKVDIPNWAVQAFWVVVIAAVIIIAIRFVSSL